MDFEYWQKNWDRFGEEDPLWAILTDPAKKGGKWEPSEFFATGEAEVTDLLKDLAARRIGYQPGSALDFGCGVGRLTQALAPHFEEVQGVDVSPAMVDGANRYNRFPAKCQYHVNKKPDLSLFPSATFDFIYSNIVLQHIPPQHALVYVQEFLRILRPGGLAIFQVLTPTVLRCLFPQSLVDRYRRMKHKDAPIIGMFGVSRRTLEQIIRQGQGTVLHVQEFRGADLGWRWISRRYFVRKAGG